MIKLIYCLRRRPEIERAAFQHYWLATHAPLVEAAAGALHVERYVQCHTVDTPLNAALADSRGCAVPAYDGAAELWWADEAALTAAMATPEGAAAGATLLRDEARFIDFAASAIFFTREEVIIDRGT